MLGRAAILLLVISVGCGSDGRSAREYVDVGTFCVTPAAGGLTFRVFVAPNERCLSACDTNELSCRATLSGNRIELRSLLEVRDEPGVSECPTGCLGSTGRCELDAPSTGEYEFGFASRVDRVTLPFAGSIPLFGEHACEADDPMPLDPFR